MLILKELCLRFANLSFICEQIKELLTNVFLKSEVLIGFKEDVENIIKVSKFLDNFSNITKENDETNGFFIT